MGRPMGHRLSKNTKRAISDAMKERYALIRELLEVDNLSIATLEEDIEEPAENVNGA